MKHPFSPPRTCDNCGRDIVDVFSDCRTIMGYWAYLCDWCLPALAIGQRGKTGLDVWYGLGIGQRFEKAPDGKFYKTRG